MNSEELKEKCAYEALKYIKSGDTIGLGGGRTIASLIQAIKEKDIKVNIVSPSHQTRLLCKNYGLPVQLIDDVTEIDLVFDGCDEVDSHLYALKSGGGIHTLEKLIANMAKEYIILADESKFVPELSFKHPITLEILKESASYVQLKVKELGGTPNFRTSLAKDGYTITEHGNLLLDVQFARVRDIIKLNQSLKGISGVIETSLFTNEVSMVIVAGINGIQTIRK